MWVNELKEGDRFISCQGASGLNVDGEDMSMEGEVVGFVLGTPKVTSNGVERLLISAAFDFGVTGFIDIEEMRDPNAYRPCTENYVVYDPDAPADACFWSNAYGWGELRFASRFLEPAGNLPMTENGTACWVPEDEVLAKGLNGVKGAAG